MSRLAKKIPPVISALLCLLVAAEMRATPKSPKDKKAQLRTRIADAQEAVTSRLSASRGGDASSSLAAEAPLVADEVRRLVAAAKESPDALDQRSSRVLARIASDAETLRALNAPAESIDGERRIAANGSAVLRGTITDVETASPIAGADVFAVRRDAQNYVLNAARTTTGADGRYELGAMWSGAVELTITKPPYISRVDTFTIDWTAAATHDVALTPGAMIRGQVTSYGLPVAYADIWIYDGAGQVVATGRTDDGGDYSTSTGLPAGTYYASAARSPSYLRQIYSGFTCSDSYNCDPTSGTAIAVSAKADVSGINFSLLKDRSIGGNVRDASSQAPVYSAVTLYDATGSYLQTAYGSQYSFAVNADGPYYVAVANAPSGYTSQVYALHDCAGACVPTGGDSVTVPFGQQRADVDFTLQPTPARIRGQVTASGGGTPLPNVRVRAFASSGYAESYTDASGRYNVTLPSPGSWSVTFSRSDYYGESNGGARCGACDVATGVPVSVAAAQSVDVNATLDLYTRVSGVIRSRSTGDPIWNALVILRSGTNETYAFSDASGSYTFPGIAPGTYTLRVEYTQYVSYVYGGGDCVDCSTVGGTPISVSAGSEVVVPDIALAEGRMLRGGVVDSLSGRSVDGAVVSLYDAAGVLVGKVNSSSFGSFNFGRRFTAGPYYAVAEAPGYRRTLYSAIDCASCNVTSGTPIQLTSDDTMIQIPLLPDGGLISGTVLWANTNAPATTAVVYVRSANGTIYFTRTDNLGRWFSTPLPAGQYRVYMPTNYGHLFFFSDPTVYQGQSYPLKTCDEPCDGSFSTPVNVTYGAITSNVDFIADTLGISEVVPDVAPTLGGTTHEVRGTGFVDGATVTVGGSTATVLSVTPTAIRFVAPPGRGNAAIRVTNPSARYASRSYGLRYDDDGTTPVVLVKDIAPQSPSGYSSPMRVTPVDDGVYFEQLTGIWYKQNGNTSAEQVRIVANTTPNMVGGFGSGVFVTTNLALWLVRGGSAKKVHEGTFYSGVEVFDGIVYIGSGVGVLTMSVDGDAVTPMSATGRTPLTARSFVSMNGETYFAGATRINPVFEGLFKIVNNAAVEVFAIPGSATGDAGNVIAPLLVKGDRIFFWTSPENRDAGALYTSDGTTAGTVVAQRGSMTQSVLYDDGFIYFIKAPNYNALDSSSNFGPVWRTDGTSAGTQPVLDQQAQSLARVNGKLFVTTASSIYGYDGSSWSLWADTQHLPRLTAPWFATLGSDIIFGAPATSCVSYQCAYNVWALSTSTPSQPRAIGVRSDGPSEYVQRNGKVYFAGYDEQSGSELWETDGTFAGSKQLAEIATSSSSVPSQFGNTASGVIFRAADGSTCCSSLYWTSDGTEVGTQRITGIATYGQDDVTTAGNRAFISSQFIPSLWSTDGTAGGLTELKLSSPATSPIAVSALLLFD